VPAEVTELRLRMRTLFQFGNVVNSNALYVLPPEKFEELPLGKPTARAGVNCHRLKQGWEVRFSWPVPVYP
jgi:hypothetical protein